MATLLACVALVVAPLAARAQVSVLSYHNDLASTGQNLSENQLIPANVNAGTFGKIFSAPVDGQLYGQSLYVPGPPITAAGTYQGTTHDTVFVSTQNDSVYAFDAVSGAQLWHLSVINNAGGEVPVSQAETNTGDITPEVGIVSTPVIDPTPNPTTQLRYLYVVAKSRLTIARPGWPRLTLKASSIYGDTTLI